MAAPTASEVTAEQRLVCAAAMQALFSKPYVFIRSGKVGEVEVQQFRNAENTYANSCYLDEDAVVWRTDKTPNSTAPGRWRTAPQDDKLTWTRDEVSVTIRKVFPDGTGDRVTYSMTSLTKTARLPR